MMAYFEAKKHDKQYKVLKAMLTKAKCQQYFVKIM